MKIVVAGRGLIGGSLYKAAERAGLEASCIHHDETQGIAEADIVFAALPPEAIIPWLRENAKRFKNGAIVVDVCGVKKAIMAEAKDVEKAGWTFIGGHPMAGREVSGFENSKADLFDGASLILVEEAGADSGATEKLKDVAAKLGFGMVVVTTAERHDEMIAFTSQLCHVIATAYSRDARVENAIGFSAGSYANMTRIATQDANTWASLYLTNRTELLKVLDGFIGRLAEFRSALSDGNRDAVEAIIAEGTQAKIRELATRTGIG